MTNEQKSSYVFAQTALMLVELEAMKAENQARTSMEAAPAYPATAFWALHDKYNKTLTPVPAPAPVERVSRVERVELQIAHYCCECGRHLPAGSRAPRTVVSVQCDLLASSVGIAWCDECVKTLASHSQIKDNGR